MVRHNVIKRIGEYKMAVVGAAPLAVRYTAEGIPSPAALREQIRSGRRALAEGGLSAPLAEEPEGEEIALVMVRPVRLFPGHGGAGTIRGDPG